MEQCYLHLRWYFFNLNYHICCCRRLYCNFSFSQLLSFWENISLSACSRSRNGNQESRQSSRHIPVGWLLFSSCLVSNPIHCSQFLVLWCILGGGVIAWENNVFCHLVHHKKQWLRVNRMKNISIFFLIERSWIDVFVVLHGTACMKLNSVVRYFWIRLVWKVCGSGW